LGAELVLEPGQITIKPLLLNKKDSLTFKILVSEYNGFNVDARIIGVREIKNYGYDHKEPSLTWSDSILLMGCTALFMSFLILALIGLLSFFVPFGGNP
jgi:hypothetical protein